LIDTHIATKLTGKKMAAKTEETNIILDFIKSLAWPIFGIILLVCFWTSLHDIASLIPNLLRRAESITISKLAIRMSHSVIDNTSPEVRQVLAELESIDITNILSQPYEGTVYVTDEWNLAMWRRLSGLRLVTELSGEEVRKYNSTNNVKVVGIFQINPLFVQTRNVLVSFTGELISEAKASLDKEEKSKPKE
jgi:hypothetical protein